VEIQWRSLRLCIGGLAMLLACQQSIATPIDVTIDTSALSGLSGTLVFDLIDSSTASSSLTINNFSGDFVPGSPSLTGDASGTIAAGFSLTDSQFFNEVAVPVQFGNTTGFSLDFSFGTPEPLEFPDEFSVFLLTSDMSASLFGTGDPSGADSILTYYVDANGTANLSTYDASDGSVTIRASTATVPEPSSFALMIVPLVSILRARRKAR